MKGSRSGLIFDNVQESAWRDSEIPGKIGIAAAIRNGDLPNIKSLAALPLEPTCSVKQD
jgi:hypothetical protein